MDVESIVIKCLEENGICVSYEKFEDINLLDYAIDSVTFVSFIVALEEYLEMEIPDNYLRMEVLQSLRGFIRLLEQLKSDNINSL